MRRAVFVAVLVDIVAADPAPAGFPYPTAVA